MNLLLQNPHLLFAGVMALVSPKAILTYIITVVIGRVILYILLFYLSKTIAIELKNILKQKKTGQKIRFSFALNTFLRAFPSDERESFIIDFFDIVNVEKTDNTTIADKFLKECLSAIGNRVRSLYYKGKGYFSNKSLRKRDTDQKN